MTRFLSEALDAVEPAFSRTIQKLEQAAGLPSADVRLTADIIQKTRNKISQLGLDPDDTTGPELFEALKEKLKHDEQAVLDSLWVKGAENSSVIIAAVVQFIRRKEKETNQTCFVLKASSVKRLLKKRPPKLAMKRLGYRSVDSMLKHESVSLIYAAATMVESNSWKRFFRDQYSKLTPSDFESRIVTILHPSAKRWQNLAKDFTDTRRRHLFSFPELGSIVLLPITENVDGLAITTILLTCEEINSIRAYSSYVKLQQVKPDFGKIVKLASINEPNAAAEIAGQPVPWRIVQRFYSRKGNNIHPEIFEPHVQAEDLGWTSGESLLESLDPLLGFWKDTASLGLMHDNQIVSCNALDVALGYCNNLSFADRVVHFVRDNLWHELMMRYLHQDNLESAMQQQLAGQMSGEQVETLPDKIEAEAV